MTTLPPDLDGADLLAAVRSVHGVLSAELGPLGAPDEGLLRMSLAPGSDEVAVAMQVGTLLRERFGLGVDTAGVQLVEEATAVSETGPGSSVTIERLQVVSAGRDVDVAVSLHRAGVLVSGTARTSATSAAGVLTAVAEATLRAAEQLVAGLEADLDDASVDEGWALVSVTIDPDGRALQRRGQAPVHTDARQAMARAALDAVGRDLAGD